MKIYKGVFVGVKYYLQDALTAASNGYERDGGGIYLLGSAPKISNSIITANESEDDGGGIYCFNSAPLIEYSLISNNNAGDDAGGIYLRWCDPGPT